MDEGRKNLLSQTQQTEQVAGSVVVEFLPITPEDLEQIKKLRAGIWRKFKGVLPGFKKYTGIEKDIGVSTVYNTPVTAGQLMFALAMTRHPLLYQMIQNQDVNKDNFNAEELVENKIMRGMKILDLGSSDRPIFARCCRYMGADVWTVDIDTIEEHRFGISNQLLTPEIKKLEIERHISLDLLRSDEAVDKINQLTGGNFNLVTEAHLRTDGVKTGKSIGLALLKKGGVYYETCNLESELKT